MMASSKVMKYNNIALIICIALMCAPLLSTALTCCDLKRAFDACREYSINGGTCVPKDCCFEALNVRNMIMSNHKDTVDACHCILDAAGKLPNINGTAFAHIPEGCGIHLPFNFHIGMNCQSVY
ncbi:unnamed protein product [Trifolium pratense]|uniref:Uncharacterized protein n=1 Tax=Trifolium pratense TaxID=57577 RepID=A0ACB0LR48_TRIPR|nr:unnamed protein product [Trifolium pratense]